MRLYYLPPFLDGVVSQQNYDRWLDRKAATHFQRDRARGNKGAIKSGYKQAIHSAALSGGDKDAYTGESLDWTLISTYDNKLSKAGRRSYKKKFALLPTVDHVGDGQGDPDFVICGWRTNDCKNDLTAEELVAFCKSVLSHSAAASGAVKQKRP